MKKPIIPQNKNYSNLFDTINFQQEFNDALTFVSELCEVPYVILTLNNEDSQKVVKSGFDFFTIPEELLLFTGTIIQENKIYIVPDINKNSRYQCKDENHPIAPFVSLAGISISITDSDITGTLCVMDIKHRELSAVHLKVLQHSALQIKKTLQLLFQNKKLQIEAEQNKNPVLQYIENSKEIVFQINLAGNFSYISNNWTSLFGHEINETIGNHFSLFIHPDDIEKCNSYIKQTIENGQIEHPLKYRKLHKNGNYIWYATHLKLIQKEEEEEPFFIGISRDISETITINQKLKEQKDFYEKILDKLPIDVVALDDKNNFLYLNPSSIEDKKLKEFIIGKNDIDYAKHIGRSLKIPLIRYEKFLEAKEFKKNVEWNEAYEDVDGQTKHYSRKIAPIYSEDGLFEMMIGIGINITEKKKIEKEISKSKALTNIIIKNTAIGIILKGPNSEVIDYNNTICEMFGLTREQIFSANSYDTNWNTIYQDGTEFKYKDYPSFKAAEQLIPIKNVVMGVFRHQTQDLIWLSADAIPVFDTNTKLQYIVCSFNDITERINVLEELRISNERFTYSNKATHEAIWDWDIVNDVITTGEGYATIFGHQFQNNILTSEASESLTHPEDLEAVLESINNALKSKTNQWRYEYRFLKSDGSYAYVDDKAVIIRNEDGKAIRMVGATKTITEEKKLRDKLLISEKQFKGVFKNSPVGKALITPEGHWKEVNNKVCEILGYTKNELNKLTFQELTYYEDLEEDLDYLKKINSGELDFYNMEKRYIHKNKSIVWGLLSVSVVRDNTGQITHYISEIIDITERKTIEHENKILTQKNNQLKTIELNEVKNLYRLLADNTVDLVCLHNTDGTFQYVSPSVTNLLGYKPEDLIDQSPNDFVYSKHATKIQTVLSPNNKESTFEIRLRNINGNYFWFETKIALVLENNIIKGYHSTTRKISQRKKAEKAIIKTINQQQQLNELRTNLVSTISHEFRTPMTTIRTSAELISMYIEGHDFENSLKLKKRLNIITHEIDRIVELMNDILIISKDDLGKTNFNPIIIDFKELCNNLITRNYFNRTDGRNVQILTEGSAFTIFADKNLMENTLVNLLDNAFKYSEGSGDVILKLFSTSSVVDVEIIDYGIGIPETDQPKLFNTFFRASNTNGIQGTGLGLYIVKKFTEKNSGKLHLESKLGIGTKVTLKFPLHKSN